MAFPTTNANSSQGQFLSPAFVFGNPPPQNSDLPRQNLDDPSFDIFEWYPKYLSCQRYFLDVAQHSFPVHAVAALVNVHLPYQRNPEHISSSNAALRLPPTPSSNTFPPSGPSHQQHQFVSLIPYIRRLVVTGMDETAILHGFFGDDWAAGVGCLHEQERRNYLFAAKSGGWASVKRDYDMLPLETVPYMRPLQKALEPEVRSAERSWSEWLAMEDWMVGPRTPPSMAGVGVDFQRRNERGGT